MKDGEFGAFDAFQFCPACGSDLVPHPSEGDKKLCTNANPEVALEHGDMIYIAIHDEHDEEVMVFDPNYQLRGRKTRW